MSKGTRGTADKDEVERNFQLAQETYNRTKSNQSETHHTSTPNKTTKNINFSLDETVIEKDFEKKFSETAAESHFADSCDKTIIPEFNKSEKKKDLCGTGSNITQNNPLATLKYAVEAVPYFDGQNIPLNYFIEGCEEAKSMLPSEAESQFTKIIRTRIIGEARRTIQGQDFDSVSQLIKYLKQIYGPAKNVYQLQGELGCIYQKGDEDVITYANRVKILGKQILETYRSSGNVSSDQNIKASLEKDMCKCFIRGLKPEIEQRVARNLLNVQETAADAIRIERELRAMTDLRQGIDSISGRQKSNNLKEICQICYKEGHVGSNCKKYLQTSQQINNQIDVGTAILVCQICKKRGHGAEKCRFRDPQQRRPVNVVQGKIITCQLCLKSGHDAKSCRQNNTTNNNKISVICQWCERSGHSANNCWKKQNEQRYAGNKTRVTCQICNNFGHIAKDCRSKLNQQTGSRNSLFCRYCKEQGHLLENCQLRHASNFRKKENNQGNYNGPSTSGAQQGSKREPHPSKTQVAK